MAADPPKLVEAAPAATPAASAAQPNEPAPAADGNRPDPASPPTAPDAGQPSPAGAPAPALKQFEKVSAENLAIADHQIVNQYFQDITNRAAIRSLSSRDGWQLTEEREAELSDLFVGDAAEVERLVARVSEQRIVLLSGPVGIGKATLAMHVGHLLAKRSEVRRRTWVIPPLERSVRVDLQELARRPDDSGNRVVIFADALARGNADLAACLQRTESTGWDELARLLRKSAGFFIFTASHTTIAEWRQRLVEYGLHHEVAAPPQALLAGGLDVRLDRIEAEQPAMAGRIGTLRANRDQLVADLPRIPRLARFVDYYLHQDDAALTVEEAVKRFNATAHAFLREIAGDGETWTFTVALALAHAAPDTTSVPWIHVERLRQIVRRVVRRERERRRDADEDATLGGDTVDLSASDHTLLERCRAEVWRDAEQAVDLVRFQDGDQASQLWDALLAHHRRLLCALMPVLRDAAEDSQGEEPGMRVTAARILGRLGELDAVRVLDPLVSRWADAADPRWRPLVGSLFEGTLASADLQFRAASLGRLKALGTSGNGSDDDEKSRIVTAIAALARIGAYDLPFAMTGLGAIAVAKLAPVMDDSQRLARILERVESQINAEPSRRTEGLFIVHALLSEWTRRLYSEQSRTMIATQYALTSLCYSRDPIEVFSRLRDWINLGGPAAGLLVALLFLHEDGLASKVELFAVPSAASDGERSSSLILLSLSANEDGVDRMAKFLAAIDEVVSSSFKLPAQSQRYFQASLFEHMKTWARESVKVPSQMDAVVRLFAVLSTVHQGRLAGPVHQLLSSRDFTDTADMQALATAVRLQLML